MLKMKTDDEIAGSGCIEEQRKISFTTHCATNPHYKTQMCEIMVRRGTRTGSIEQCAKDPSFKGHVVEQGGIGA